MTDFTVNVAFTFTEERLEDLFSCARQNYWVGAWFEDDGDGNELKHPLIGDQHHTDDGWPQWREDWGNDTMKFQEDEENGLYSLTPEKIAKGLRLLSEGYPKHFGWFLDENEDAETGDIFLQLALFGTVQYG